MSGHTRRAVQLAVISGRLTPASYNPMMFDEDEADVQWSENTRSRVKNTAPPVPVPKPEPVQKARTNGKPLAEVERLQAAKAKAKEPKPKPTEPEKPKKDPEVVAAAKAYNDARTRQAIADADLSELKRDQAASKLVSADDVRQAWKIAARALRDGILALPDRVAELVAATDSAEECRQLLDTEIRKILNKLSDAPPDPRTGS